MSKINGAAVNLYLRSLPGLQALTSLDLMGSTDFMMAKGADRGTHRQPVIELLLYTRLQGPLGMER
jgi:hypothetical protein